ncbi:hypothetical protein SLEP1_g55069 [Rubroshorea leprosula]|uniref:Uncharacterized protein n=1 Tax=Rubroshorea leprosula TaxID=152421 RepID=A0AAV5MHA4_9ROSI|nr:hypothetical protein SLEP1_g55069 [Rubroshorea leprosula]
MDVLMDDTTGCEMYLFIDGSSGYNQVSMYPSDEKKAAFRIPINNFYYVVMPFGLKNAKATYQRVMVAIFHDFIHIYIEVYIGDIVGATFTRIEEQQHAFLHLQDLMLILPTISVPIQGRLLKVYLSTSSKAVGALVAEDDEEGKEQPVYYVNRNLKGVESRAGTSVVLKDDKGHDAVFSFKLEFQCTNNMAEYEAYLIGLAMAKEAGVQLLKIIGNSEQSFANIRYEQVPQTKNWLADALATITSKVPMVEYPFSVQVVQKDQIISNGSNGCQKISNLIGIGIAPHTEDPKLKARDEGRVHDQVMVVELYETRNQSEPDIFLSSNCKGQKAIWRGKSKECQVRLESHSTEAPASALASQRIGRRRKERRRKESRE